MWSVHGAHATFVLVCSMYAPRFSQAISSLYRNSVLLTSFAVCFLAVFCDPLAPSDGSHWRLLPPGRLARNIAWFARMQKMKSTERVSETSPSLPPHPALHRTQKQQQKQRLRRLTVAESERALVARTSVADVVVVTHDAEAVVPWKQRYEQMLQANHRLHERLEALQNSHRKAMTTVKYEPALPNNDVFTKQLVEENRMLLLRTRELELRLFGIDGRPTTASPSQARSRTAASTSKSRVKTPPHRSATVKHSSAQTDPISDPHPDQASESLPPKLSGLLSVLKTRLGELELDLDRLRQENELLRRDHNDQHDGENRSPSAAAVEITSANNRLTSCELREREELQSALQDRVRMMSLLEARYDQLTKQAHARAALYEQSLSRIEDLNEQLFNAQQQLAQQAQVIQQHEDLALENDALKKEAHLLRSETAKLNDAISTLSSRPFDAMNIDLQTKNLRIAKLEEVTKTLETQVAHAEQDVRVAKQTNARLSARVKKLQAEIERQAETLEERRLQIEHHRMAQEIAELQLRFYTSPDDKTLVCALGKAIKDMRLQDDSAINLTDFMESVGVSEKKSDRSPICAKCRASLLQGNPLERQRLAKISELTALLKEDAQAQLTSLKLLHAQQMQMLRRKARKWENQANAYLEEIRKLQRKKGDSRHISELHSVPPCTEIASHCTVITNPQAPQSQQQEDGSPDDSLSNIIELQMTDISLLGDYPTSIMLLCDYFDFESQISPVISAQSNSGAWSIDFGITYKTYQDASFFRSPASRHVHVELHRLRIGSTELIGVCSVDINALFLSSDGYYADRFKLVNPFTQAAIGDIKIVLSLEHPVDVFYKSVLHHSSRSLLKPSSFAVVSSTTSAKGCVVVRVLSLLMMKNFVADVKAATSRVSSHKTETHLELSYRFIGFPNVVIPIALPSTPSIGGYFVAPVGKLRPFEVDTSTNFIRFLERYTLEMQMLSKSGDRCYGQASVSFHEVLEQISRTRATSGYIFASFHDTTWKGGEPRLLGRACLQIELRGFPSKVAAPQFLPVTAPHVVAAIRKLFATPSSEKSKETLRLDWEKFREVMNLSQLDMALRQILNAKKTLTQGGLRSLITRLDAFLQRLESTHENDQTSLKYPFEDLESFGSFIRDGGVHLSPTELAMLLSGLHHTTRLPRDRMPSALLSTMIARKLKLLCETCDDEWLTIEESLQQRALALESLKVDNAAEAKRSTKPGSSQSEMISWDTFQERLGLHSA